MLIVLCIAMVQGWLQVEQAVKRMTNVPANLWRRVNYDKLGEERQSAQKAVVQGGLHRHEAVARTSSVPENLYSRPHQLQ